MQKIGFFHLLVYRGICVLGSTNLNNVEISRPHFPIQNEFISIYSDIVLYAQQDIS